MGWKPGELQMQRSLAWGNSNDGLFMNQLFSIDYTVSGVYAMGIIVYLSRIRAH